MKVVAYCRVSTNKEEQLDSLESQQKFFGEYSKRNGYSLIKIYADAPDIIGLKQNPTKRASL